jgi:glycosyltransferase involved in cell wall biosynthesis
MPSPAARPSATGRGPADEDEDEDVDDDILRDLPQGVLAAALPRPVSVPARFAVGSARRIVRTIVRRLSIPLTIRSNVLAARQAAPVGDVYHGMAYMGIPVALDLGGTHGAPVVYDARDIYVDAANLAKSSRLVRMMVGRWERGWARRAARVLTVNKPYAQVMARRWRVKEPLIVLNCSFRTPAPPERPRRFHAALGLPPGERIVVYQGGFSHDRGIEQLIEAIAAVPGATLALLGYGRMQEQLEELAADPSTGGKLAVLPAVPPTELLDWIASADVAAMPIQPTTLNHRLTTPNKLFEAMAAGVPVVASDLPGMAAIVRDAGCGLLVDPTDPAAIAAAIRAILDLPEPEYEAWRARCAAAAMESYNWERQMEVVLAEYGRLTGRPW